MHSRVFYTYLEDWRERENFQLSIQHRYASARQLASFGCETQSCANQNTPERGGLCVSLQKQQQQPWTYLSDERTNRLTNERKNERTNERSNKRWRFILFWNFYSCNSWKENVFTQRKYSFIHRLLQTKAHFLKTYCMLFLLHGWLTGKLNSFYDEKIVPLKPICFTNNNSN
jgi:hypothetical protein